MMVERMAKTAMTLANNVNRLPNMSKIPMTQHGFFDGPIDFTNQYLYIGLIPTLIVGGLFFLLVKDKIDTYKMARARERAVLKRELYEDFDNYKG